MKKIVSLICAVTMTAAMFMGCTGTSSSASSDAADSNSASGASSVDENPSGSASSVADSAFDQEDIPLNIVDDNYRNYYEIFVGSFYDSNGDGIGDLNGIYQKLDYIADMGFTGIWLTPIMESTTYHKYDVVDYYMIDEDFGTMMDFKNLVDGCHERGINIIIDFVMNHTSTQHEWFKTATQYLKGLGTDEVPNAEECPEYGYYHFSQKNASNYSKVSGTGWYYESVFWSEMPDLDLSNESLRREIEAIADYWIDAGIDGFRMDASMHYEENDASFNAEVLDWLYSHCLEKNPDFYMVSEVWAGSSVIADYYKSNTPSMFNFPLSSGEGALAKTANGTMKAEAFIDKIISLDSEYSASYADYIDAPFLSNHDQIRISNTLNGDPVKIKYAAGLLLTLPGNPFVYYGEEIGMKSKGTEDPNKRLPMVWSKTDDTGMTDLPDGASSGIESNFDGVDLQLDDKDSILNYYKKALLIRNQNPELARGDMVKLDALCDGTVAAVRRTYDSSSIIVIYNSSEEAATIDLSAESSIDTSTIEMRGYLTVDSSDAVTLDGTSLVMPGRSICIIK